MSQRLGPVARRLLRAPARLYDWHAGWLLGPRFVRLTHTGRRTGRRYQTILEIIGNDREVGELLVLVGMGRSADWYRNIQERPALELATMRRRFRPIHRVLEEQEAVLALAEYERRNRWALFIIRPVLSWLAGWRYDGGDEARRRLAQQLPVVAFRPDPAISHRGGGGPVPGFPELRQVVLDSTDARALAEFYRQLLGFRYRPGDEPPASGEADPAGRDWLVLRDATGIPRLAFQQVAALAKATWPDDSVPQQLHLDLTVPTKADLDVQHERALALGARLRYDRSDDPEEPLRVYADPAGHPFCIFVAAGHP